MTPHGILAFSLGLFLVGGAFTYKTGRALDPLTRRRRRIKYVGYLLIVNAVLGAAIAGPRYFTLLMSVVTIIGAYELLRVCWQKTISLSSLLRIAAIVGIYLSLAYGLVRFSYSSSSGEIIFVYLVTASLDGFSQLTGQWIGRLPLAPRISPNKTIEGAFGGFAAAMVTAFALSSLAGFSTWQAPFVGLLLAIAGLGGDLVASYVKRLNRVKDFGRMLPEHGGILDRFDSLLLAAPAFSIWRG